MSDKIDKLCRKCGVHTVHRFVRSKRPRDKGGYYSCSVCSEHSSKLHRKKYWYRYLAQKANSRKKIGSEKITEELLLSILDTQNGKCALSGIQFDVYDDFKCPSLDRIDSSLPYLPSNIQLVTIPVNKIKREFDQTEFVKLCKLIADYK